jgi:transposase
VAKLAAKYRHLTFCYEAGPTGYGLYRLLNSLGHECLVVAPSLVPKKAGDRVKTNRRDAVSLAKLLRAGELTAVWVPDERHEAMRDLSRARQAAKKDLQGKPADLVFDAEARTHLSGEEDVGASPHEVAHGAEARASRAAHRIRRAT